MSLPTMQCPPESPVRVLFIHSPSDLYGASRSLLRLSSRMVRDNNQVLVLLSSDGPLRPHLEAAGVSVQICPGLAVIDRRKYASFRGWLSLAVSYSSSILKLWRLVSSFKPDLMHTNTALILPGGVVAKLRRVPHIWHVREIVVDFPRLWNVYQWYLATFSDCIVCVSHAVAKQFHRLIQQKRICVLHNGFPLEEFLDVSSDRVTSFRKAYAVDGKMLVGLVGRINIYRKGQDVLLKAAAAVRARFPEVRFLLIGSPFPGNERHLEKLQAQIRELRLSKEAIYTGDVEDIKAAYSAVDVAVQASVMPEAFSGVVIESMAMGKPVVATRHGGTGEQIEHGVTGLLVEPGDPQQLAAALETLLSDSGLRAQLGRQARDAFVQRFEFEQFYGRLHAQQASLLARRLRKQPGSLTCSKTWLLSWAKGEQPLASLTSLDRDTHGH